MKSEQAGQVGNHEGCPYSEISDVQLGVTVGTRNELRYYKRKLLVAGIFNLLFGYTC